MALLFVHAFDQYRVFVGIDEENASGLTFVSPAPDKYCITFFDPHSVVSFPLNYLWGEGYDLHELFFAEFTGDRSEDTGSTRLVLLVDDHRGVITEPDE